MNNEKIEHLLKSGALFLPAANERAIVLANSAFQQMKASTLPLAVSNFYMEHGGVILGDACMFPIDDVDRPGRSYILPGIIKINREILHLDTLRGKTIWGQNQFYFFMCDATGSLYMQDVLTLSVLRKYGDFYQALSDCLLVGKV